MKNEELYGIPMRHLIEDNCLVVVWATNKQAQLKFIQDRLFPAWKVEFLAHWFWLKVFDNKFGHNLYNTFSQLLSLSRETSFFESPNLQI